jgi:hypothetical protein
MNVVCIVSGLMRTAEQCAPIIRDIYPDATFLVHASRGVNTSKAAAFRPHLTIIEEQPCMHERDEYYTQQRINGVNIQFMLRQLWGLRQSWKYFGGIAERADVVVRLRADLLFRVPPESPTPAFHVPSFSNWFGLNDQFAYGSPDIMRRYFTRLDRLDEYIDQGGTFHPESFLAWAMESVPVHRTRAVFDLLRLDGTRTEPVRLPHCGDWTA